MIEYLTSHLLFPFSINIIFFNVFLFLNIFLPISVGLIFKIDLEKTLKIITINFIFLLIYIAFVNSFGGDGFGWYRKPWFNDEYTFERCGGILYCSRERLILKLALIFKDLKIHYLNSILLLNILSCMVFLLLYSRVKHLFIFKNFNFFLLVFMITYSGALFWGSGFLKDNFILFAIALFMISIDQNKINYKILSIAVLISFLIRPLPGFFMLSSVFLYVYVYRFYFKKDKMSRNNYLFIFLFITLGVFTFFQYGISLNSDFASDIIRKMQILSNSNNSKSYLDGELTYDNGISVLTKYFLYYFGPMRFDSPLFIILSVQNFSILLITSLFFILIIKKFNLFKKFIKHLGYKNIYFIYLILYNMIVPITAFNGGIALRQKWMSLIVFFYLAYLFTSFVAERVKKNKKT